MSLKIYYKIHDFGPRNISQENLKKSIFFKSPRSLFGKYLKYYFKIEIP